jgi:ABC-type lipoprotein export system ATPase subunit
MAERTLVRAISLGRTYGSGGGRVSAISEATFALEAGDRVALVGPSGSGKTTLIHLIAGLDRPTEGSISWPALGSRDTLRPGPISLAFQGPSLLPPLTVLENVALPVILAGGGASEATIQARALLEIFEVDVLAEKLPEELSGGQLQRAGLARAFVGTPRLILADEPTGQQDRATARRMVDAILTMATSHDIALVIATHDTEVARALPARWAMRDGILSIEEVACSA